MNIEEKLWNYIDGACNDAEQQEMSNLIAANEAVRLKYHELLALNTEFAAMDLDDPPMAFTYNVMEAIRTEYAQQPLKAAPNKIIIRGIGLFFVITILTLLVFTLSQMDFSGGIATVKVPAEFKMPNIGSFITKPVMECFLFFDTILGLFLLDKYLRKKAFGHKTDEAY